MSASGEEPPESSGSGLPPAAPQPPPAQPPPAPRLFGEPVEGPPAAPPPPDDTRPLPAHGGWHGSLPPRPTGPPPWPVAQPLPPGTPPRAGALPGWVWPLLVATGVVFGLVGGLLGGALVLGTRDGSSGGVLPSDPGARPLAADNGSVAAVAERVLPSTVQVRVTQGEGAETRGATGSGFVVDDEGHVITNNHVVAGAADGGEVVVVDVDGRRHDATIVGRSPVYDLAVLDVERTGDLEPAALGSSHTMQVGETVVAIGSPLGLSATVTAGIVSAVDRPVTTGSAEVSSYINAVQTDAAINPGNSGGPLVNMRGQVVGVNSAIATTGSPLGGESGNIGVGFAIPMEQVRVTAQQILQTGRAEYPVIGANVATGDTSDGAEIVGVPAGSPAASAGLREGDRVVAVEETRVSDGISMIVAIRSHRPGETIELRVVRGGREQTVQVRLEAKVG